jgi:two-component system response regulator
MTDVSQELEVLLVEDTATDAELCIRTLKKQNMANQIVWVKDGAEALDYLFGAGAAAGTRPLPRVVLLDLQLPKVSGLEVLQKIKGDKYTKDIPVVVLTSSKDDRDIVKSYRLGVNSFISKPVSFDAFVETITQLGLYWLVINHPPDCRVGGTLGRHTDA